MDFNIKKYLEKKRSLSLPNEQKLIIDILKDYFSSIKPNNVIFSKGVIYIKNISPQQKLQITLSKQIIIKRLSQKNVIIRDII